MKIALIKLTLLLGLFSIAACGKDDEQPEPEPEPEPVNPIDIPVYKTTVLSSFAAPGVPGFNTINGVAYDGDHLWLTMYEQVGTYTDPDTIRVIKYDHQTGTILKQFTYVDAATPNGLSFFDSRLCISQGNLRQIDTASGGFVQAWGSNSYISDIDFDSTYIVTTDVWGVIRRINPANGSLGPTITSSHSNGVEGVACRPGEVWLSSRTPQKMVVFTTAGAIKGYVQFAQPPCSACTTAGDYTCFMGTDTLVFIRDNQVHIAKVEPY